MTTESARVRIRRGELFTSEEIREAAHIGKATLQRWIDSGLPFAQPFTKSQYFTGDDVIDFMDRFRTVRTEAQ